MERRQEARASPRLRKNILRKRVQCSTYILNILVAAILIPYILK
jgi:hypothetical protein